MRGGPQESPRVPARYAPVPGDTVRMFHTTAVNYAALNQGVIDDGRRLPRLVARTRLRH
jgi:hypothetical protein